MPRPEGSRLLRWCALLAGRSAWARFSPEDGVPSPAPLIRVGAGDGVGLIIRVLRMIKTWLCRAGLERRVVGAEEGPIRRGRLLVLRGVDLLVVEALRARRFCPGELDLQRATDFQALRACLAYGIGDGLTHLCLDVDGAD